MGAVYFRNLNVFCCFHVLRSRFSNRFQPGNIFVALRNIENSPRMREYIFLVMFRWNGCFVALTTSNFRLLRNLGLGVQSREHGRNVSIATYLKLPMVLQEIGVSYLNQ